MAIAEDSRNKSIELQSVKLDGDSYFKITNHDQMDPFFMSIVSDGNHWMFISSNGGLSAGRKDSNFALFPYYTDDKLTELQDNTGSKSIFWTKQDGKDFIWEPFSIRGGNRYQVSRNLYKSIYGNKIIFEEINHDLALAFTYQWSFSNKYGFVRTSNITNLSDADQQIKLLDGIQNIMPHGVGANLQEIRSNLIDAYKRSELEKQSGLGIFALSAIIVDRAEPSEALKANVAWSIGLEEPTRLLSSQQLDDFRAGKSVVEELDVKAKKGAYFLVDELTVSANQSKSWRILANVNQGPSSVVKLTESITASKDHLIKEIDEDINEGTENLIRIVGAADGFQLSSDKKRNARHYSNVLFNVMRGGIFDLNYQIDKKDFSDYLVNANSEVAAKARGVIQNLSKQFSLSDLLQSVTEVSDAGYQRLAIEYLPLRFSRRHGDPSRPWNKFSINTINEADGSKILDYEGNWRDIFQNWEALAHSYPEFIDGMIFKFLNASTFDGYNPYRVTKGEFDWEVIEEHDPWSYIGYWGDHQIIYLLKFLEFIEDHYPEKLAQYFHQDLFVYANVPYKIKPYQDLLADPKDTILFDEDLDREVRKKRSEMGSDGALVTNQFGDIHQVNLIEKLLATTLAKLSNFIPEAGIWLNTQRPEWNDANNALVGNGVSMVTLCYLRRFMNHTRDLLSGMDGSQQMEVSSELKGFYDAIIDCLTKHQSLLSGKISDKDRKSIMDGLGQAGSEYRECIYQSSFVGSKESITIQSLIEYAELTLEYLDHSIEANVRHDGMYHAYNIMSVMGDDEVSISYLDEMLEGQVAVLSSGYLSSTQALSVLDAMKGSKLFRPDQYSYLLYPNKELPGFLTRNIIPSDLVDSSDLLKQLLADGNVQIIEKDVKGQYHFNGNFNNAESLKAALAKLPESYESLIDKDRSKVLGVFESVFNHKAFTGRSGTFYGFEGLGSIYWHMVSKLLLAVEECCLKAANEEASPEIVGKLMEHYYEINEGIGAHKSPELYGAFPIDPYSHTPTGKGAQQPGMTGQVKEDILSRIGELGVVVKQGELQFNPVLLRKSEFISQPRNFHYIDLNQKNQTLQIPADSLAYCYCQVPVVYHLSDKNQIELHKSENAVQTLEGLRIDGASSREIFQRSGSIQKIVVHLDGSMLK